MTATTFSELELDDRLIDALRDKGYDRPTAIQAAAIPPRARFYSAVRCWRCGIICAQR